MNLIIGLILLILPTISHSLEISISNSSVGAIILEREPILIGDKYLNNIEELYFFTKVDYPDWSSEREGFITHIWYYKNQQASIVQLGIGSSNWRTYSKKKINRNSIGEWRVEAQDENGNILATQTFNIIDEGS